MRKGISISLLGILFLTSCNSSSSEKTTKLNVFLQIHTKDPEAVKQKCGKGTGNFSDLGPGPKVLEDTDGTPVIFTNKDGKTLQTSYIDNADFGKEGTDRSIPSYASEGAGDSDTCIYWVEFAMGPIKDVNDDDLRIPFTEPIASNEFYVQIGKRSPIMVKGDMLELQPRLAGYEDYPDAYYLPIFLSPADDNGGFEIPRKIGTEEKWYPDEYSEFTSGIATKWNNAVANTDLGRAVGLQIIVRDGCQTSLYVQANVFDSTGAVIGYTNATTGKIPEFGKANLSLSIPYSQGKTVELTDINCR